MLFSCLDPKQFKYFSFHSLILQPLSLCRKSSFIMKDFPKIVSQLWNLALSLWPTYTSLHGHALAHTTMMPIVHTPNRTSRAAFWRI